MSSPQPDQPDLRAVDGRVPGRRGRATRQRLLDQTASMLRTSSYRDLKVIDIAREAGTSPATFYQYFSDVDAAILVLAEEMAAQRHRFVDHVTGVRWRGAAGYPAALALAQEFVTFWDEHQPVLRVVDLATMEGDHRFREARTRLLNGLFIALGEAIAELQRAGRQPPQVEPAATAGALVSMLAHVAAHREGFEAWGVRTDDLVISMARIVTSAVSGQKPPG